MGISCLVFDRTPADTQSRYADMQSRKGELWTREWQSQRAASIFQKAFDSVPHDILLKKLNCEFGVKDSLFDLICNYLSGRQQITVLNGVKSDLPLSMGTPEGSVLGPTLFVLFTNDFPSYVPSGSVYMYAGDTTIYCVGGTADLAIDERNRAL